MGQLTARLALALTTGALVAGLLVAPATPAVAADTGTIDILVLGDSYSAGNGATDDQGQPQTYGPDGCLRSRVNWSEKYAAALRATGQPVRVVNHACSGGVTADLTAPRVMDTVGSFGSNPDGVTTTAAADAYLARTDPCNPRRFPDEEFWTYRTTNVTSVLITFDCTRNLRPQADFVTSDVDLVLFTMGGNDAGFSSIVQSCFVPVLRTATGCRGKVDDARAALPGIRTRLLGGLAALRAHGLRDDARVVQLGYPWLQLDNGFTLPDPPGYDAGAQVRALVTEGNAAIASAVPDANVAHPGQVAFLAGVPEAFSGHEPDATTPLGNPARWLNQVGDGNEIAVWYHPNRLGHTAYADLLLTHGTFGAPTGPPAGPPASTPVTARLRAHRHDGTLRIKVTLSDGSRPRGKVTVRDRRTHRVVARTTLHRRDRGATILRVPAAARLRVVYRDRTVEPVRVRVSRPAAPTT